MSATVSYQHDVVAWANEQARLLRAGRFELLDIANIAEEIEDVGKSEQRELASRMSVLLAHLLKWQFQAEKRGRSWRSTIDVQRVSLKRRLDKTPSLKATLDENDWWADSWADARDLASKETGIGFDQFPIECHWTKKEVLDSEFFPQELTPPSA